MSTLQDHSTGPFQQGTRVKVDGEYEGTVEKWCGGQDYIVLAHVQEGKTTRLARLAVDRKRLTLLEPSSVRPGVVTK